MNDEGTLRRVLVTGAYGLIGNLTFAHLARMSDRYEPYGMVRRTHASSRLADADLVSIPDDRLRMGDIRDADAVRSAVDGIDVVVHLAADPDGRGGWESVLESNIVGSYNVFEACRDASVKRVVFASSNQVVFGYRAEEPYRTHFAVSGRESLGVPIPPIRHDQPPRPPNLYACSKLFGENLAWMYSHRYEMSCLCLRIGWVTRDDVVANPSLFCSRRDVTQAIVRAIEAPDDLRYDAVFVQSRNTPNFVDIEHTWDVLGYEPQDRGEDQPSVRADETEPGGRK